MARLTPDEKKALREFAKEASLPRFKSSPLPVEDFLRSISNLPASLRPPKPVRFVGKDWKL